jgi:hypothetical protein
LTGMAKPKDRRQVPTCWTDDELLGEAEAVAEIFDRELARRNRVSLCLRELVRRYVAVCRGGPSWNGRKD